MEVHFGDPTLSRLEGEKDFSGGFPATVIRGFRKVMQAIRAATDERDLYAMRSFRFEKLKGNRSHQRSLRLNDQWRLIVEVVPARPKNILRIMGIEDYH